MIEQSNRRTIATAPSVEPVTTAEMKTHLRVTQSNDDTYIDSLVVAARQQAEKGIVKNIKTCHI